MDTYMYTCTITNNWTEYENSYENDYENDYAKDYEGDYEDFEDDFDPEIYNSTINPTINKAGFGLLQRIPTAVAYPNELEFKHPTVPVAHRSTFDYASVHPDHWPSIARAIKALWNDDELRRPAYVEISYSREGGFACPNKRTDYSSNWLRIKKAMGFNMQLPAMIRRSPLQQSMTWEEDSKGGYIREDGFPSQPACPPPLCYDSHSDEEQDESQTPLASPFIVSFYEKKGQFEEYNANTAVIDIISNNDEGVEIKTSGEFADFNHISDSLDIKDILGYTERSTRHDHIDKTTVCHTSIPNCRMHDITQPADYFWEKEITATGGIRHNHVGGRVQDEACKPTPSLFSSALMSCTQSGSTSAVDGHIANKSTVPTVALNNSHVCQVTVVDLTTANMTHTLTTGNTVMKNVTKSLKNPPCAGSWTGDKAANTQKNALSLIGFVEKAQATIELDTTIAEAAHIIPPVTKCHIDTIVEECILSENHNNCACMHRDLASLVEESEFSSDSVHVGKPGRSTMLCNIPSESRLLLPTVPWGRIAAATAGALAGFIGTVTRR